LSEAREADLLLHVIDAADPLRDEHIQQVDAVLAEIGAGDLPQVLVYNKMDRVLVEAAPTQSLHSDHTRHARVWLSAKTGQGLDTLRAALSARLGLHQLTGEIRLPPSAGRLRARCLASTGLTDTACTFTKRSSAPGTGLGKSRSSNDCGSSAGR